MCVTFLYKCKAQLRHCKCEWIFPSIYECAMKGIRHDDVIKWKHFPRYWPFVRGIHRSPVNSPHTGQWRRALMLSLICVWISGWVNNGEAGDLRRYRGHYDVTVMESESWWSLNIDVSLLSLFSSWCVPVCRPIAKVGVWFIICTLHSHRAISSYPCQCKFSRKCGLLTASDYRLCSLHFC